MYDPARCSLTPFAFFPKATTPAKYARTIARTATASEIMAPTTPLSTLLRPLSLEPLSAAADASASCCSL